MSLCPLFARKKLGSLFPKADPLGRDVALLWVDVLGSVFFLWPDWNLEEPVAPEEVLGLLWVAWVVCFLPPTSTWTETCCCCLTKVFSSSTFFGSNKDPAKGDDLIRMALKGVCRLNLHAQQVPVLATCSSLEGSQSSKAKFNIACSHSSPTAVLRMCGGVTCIWSRLAVS